MPGRKDQTDTALAGPRRSRRMLLAGGTAALAVLAAEALARPAPAAADNGGNVILGQVNTETAVTVIKDSAPGNAGLEVDATGGTGLVGTSTSGTGVIGSGSPGVSGTSASGEGVSGGAATRSRASRAPRTGCTGSPTASPVSA